MRTLIGCILAIALALSFLSCKDLGTGSGGDGKMPMRPLTASEKSIVAADNSFGFKLFAAVNQETPGQNLFISPLSVSMALGMTLNGANGTTEDAMRKTLKLQTLPQSDVNQAYASLITLLTQLDPKVQMEIANSIWFDPSRVNVEQEFKDVNAKFFDALITGLDFSTPSAAGTINDWVNQSTHGKIAEIVDNPIGRDVIMYLINAIYFKGTWTYQFQADATRDDLFTRSDGSRVPCKMMTQTVTVPFLDYDQYRGIDLPYGDAGFSMTIILPPPGTSIDDLVAQLTQAQYEGWLSRFAKQEVALFLPKFRLEYESKLVDPLSRMGMGIAFSEGLADFTGMDKRGDIFISDVKHKTFVQVDEEGTEAAAVTSVEMSRTTSVGGPAILRLDRPFLYFIREHQSGSILFMGKLEAPAF